jgi:hypothetical protein
MKKSLHICGVKLFHKKLIMNQALVQKASKKLFIICPDCFLDNYLQKYFGDNVFFVTASGIVVNTNDLSTIEGFCDFLETENISEIYVVCEISCIQLKNILKHNKPHGFYFEEVLVDLFVDNYFEISAKQSEREQLTVFAEKNILRQINELHECEMFSNTCAELGIEMKGLLLDKKMHEMEIIQLVEQESAALNEF